MRLAICLSLLLTALSARGASLTLENTDGVERLIVNAWRASIELTAARDGRLSVDYECDGGSCSAKKTALAK